MAIAIKFILFRIQVRFISIYSYTILIIMSFIIDATEPVRTGPTLEDHVVRTGPDRSGPVWRSAVPMIEPNDDLSLRDENLIFL